MILEGLTEKQHEYLKNSNDKKWNIKSGATRSGKTYLDYYVIPKRILESKGDGDILLLGATRGSLERNVIKPMQKLWGAKLVSDISSNNTIQLFGRTAYTLGANKVNSVDVIRGMGVEYCYGDEVVTWHKEVFKMLESRLHLPHSKFDGTCNPKGPDHWFKKWLDTTDNLYLQNYEIDDNTFGDRVFHEELKKTYEGTVYYDRYILGKWTHAEGLIYTKFASKKENYLVHSSEIPKLDNIVIGVDFGGNESKHAFVAVGIDPRMENVYALASKRLETDLDPTDLAEEFADFLMAVEGKYGRVNITYADSAERVLPRGFRTELNRRNLDRVVRGSKKEKVSDRIHLVNKLVGENRLYITEDAESLEKALETALWDGRADGGNLERLDDGTTDVDTLDAFEYAIERYMYRLNRFIGE